MGELNQRTGRLWEPTGLTFGPLPRYSAVEAVSNCRRITVSQRLFVVGLVLIELPITGGILSYGG